MDFVSILHHPSTPYHNPPAPPKQQRANLYSDNTVKSIFQKWKSLLLASIRSSPTYPPILPATHPIRHTQHALLGRLLQMLLHLCARPPQPSLLLKELKDPRRLVDVNLDQLARLSLPQRAPRTQEFAEECLFDNEVGLWEDAELGAERLFRGGEQVQVCGVGDVEGVCGFAGLFGVEEGGLVGELRG